MIFLDTADAWVHAHPYAAVAWALATAHRRLVFHYGILLVLKNAVARRILLGSADDVLAAVDDFRAELKDDLDAAKAAQAAPKIAPPAPTPPTPSSAAPGA